MSTPAVDRFLTSARIGPDATPHEAAAHVWARVVANHQIAPDSPLGQLGVFDRVVLVLRDAYCLSEGTVAAVLHTEADDIGTAHDLARFRLGLPAVEAAGCDDWDAVRDAHDVGDPAMLGALLGHVPTCPTCSEAVTAAEDRRWGRRAAVSTVRRTAMFGVAPALAGTLGAAAAFVTAGVVAGAALAPMPNDPPPHPVVVDADPGLPSDQEPLQGWPPPHDPASVVELGEDPTDSDATSADDSDSATTGGPVADTIDAVDETTDTVEDTIEDAIDSVTDTVQDTVDDTTDTVDELTDPLDDTVDDTLDTLDTLDDTLDGEVGLTP